MKVQSNSAVNYNKKWMAKYVTTNPPDSLCVGFVYADAGGELKSQKSFQILILIWRSLRLYHWEKNVVESLTNERFQWDEAGTRWRQFLKSDVEWEVELIRKKND